MQETEEDGGGVVTMAFWRDRSKKTLKIRKNWGGLAYMLLHEGKKTIISRGDLGIYASNIMGLYSINIGIEDNICLFTEECGRNRRMGYGLETSEERRKVEESLSSRKAILFGVVVVRSYWLIILGDNYSTG